MFLVKQFWLILILKYFKILKLFFLVDGNWSAWTPFSSCSNTCGDGIKSRHRTCSNPAPLHGGKFCSGTKTETMTCSDGPCPGLFFFNMTEILKTFFTLKKKQRSEKKSLYMYIHNYRIYDLSCESFDILVGYTFALFVPFTFYLNFNCFFVNLKWIITPGWWIDTYPWYAFILFCITL